MAADFNYRETLHGNFKLSPEQPMTLIISVAEQTIIGTEQSVSFRELDSARHKGSVRCCGSRPMKDGPIHLEPFAIFLSA